MSPILSYKDAQDAFFYQNLPSFDPQQNVRTMLADRGEIRVGHRYQAEKLPLLKEVDKANDRNSEELESLVWTPDHGLTDKQIDQFLVVSRSVGTFARALDSSSSMSQPSLHMSAASASRDVTLFHAMDTLHKYSYDVASSVSALVPSSGPVLCRDEMEEWSASEANLFEEALEKYGKDFTTIRSDYLPWKTQKNMIEYYYMWKTTDRYVQFQQKRMKAAEAEAKLKAAYAQPFENNKQNPISNPSPNTVSEMKRILKGNGAPEEYTSGKPCESCNSPISSQWYAWTSPTGAQARLCSQCWGYLKKMGGVSKMNAATKIQESKVEHEVIKKTKMEQVSDDLDADRASAQMQQRLHRCAIAGCNKEFKMKNQLARHYATSHGTSMGISSPRPIMKTRTAFYLHTTPLTKIARRVCADIVKLRHATRSPFWPINASVKQEFLQRVIGKTPEELKVIITGRKRKQPNARLSDMAHRMGHLQPDKVTPEWLILTDKKKLNAANALAKVAFPKPPKAKDGSLLYERIPDKVTGITKSVSPSLLKRKVYEEVGEIDGETGEPVRKRVAKEENVAQPKDRGASPLPLTVQNLSATINPTTARNTLNQRIVGGPNKTKIASVTRVGSRKQIISWADAPDDILFFKTDATKKIRRTLKQNETRRLARSPCKKVINQTVAAMWESFVPTAAAAVPLALAGLVPPGLPTDKL